MKIQSNSLGKFELCSHLSCQNCWQAHFPLKLILSGLCLYIYMVYFPPEISLMTLTEKGFLAHTQITPTQILHKCLIFFLTWIAVVSWVSTFCIKIKRAFGWESKVHSLTSAKVLNDGFYFSLKDKWKLKNLDRTKSIYLNWLSKPRTPLNHQIFRCILTSNYSKNSSDPFILRMLWTFLFVQYVYLFPFCSMSLIFYHLTN